MTGLHDKDVNIIDVRKAKRYALKLLSYKGRSEKELEERIRKKGYTKQVTSSAIRYLKDIGLINDMSLAETLKKETLDNRMLSQTGAKRYMLKRGIPRDVVDNALACDENTDAENAARLVDKKLRSLRNYPLETAKRRLYNLLARRGYSCETILKVLKEKNFKEEET